MGQLFSGYVMYSLSFLLIHIGLATVLYLQFSLTGITNFGIVGFWGLGMYVFAILQLEFQMPFILAVIIASLVAGLVAWVLGRIILDLDEQAVLVGTLAFAFIVQHLATSEKWLTNGVMGYGTIELPFNLGSNTLSVYFLMILVFVVLLILYSSKLKDSPYGRLLLSIKDNEVLSQSLGKPTFKHKVNFFALTCMALGFFGALAAPLYNFIFPRMIGADITFTVWIALMLGGRKRLSGGLVGILATVGLFDFIIETIVPIPSDYAVLISNIKYLVYGITLVLVLMFRPMGILGDQKRRRVKDEPKSAATE